MMEESVKLTAFCQLPDERLALVHGRRARIRRPQDVDRDWENCWMLMCSPTPALQPPRSSAMMSLQSFSAGAAVRHSSICSTIFESLSPTPSTSYMRRRRTAGRAGWLCTCCGAKLTHSLACRHSLCECSSWPFSGPLWSGEGPRYIAILKVCANLLAWDRVS